jgi:hypothetical protein
VLPHATPCGARVRPCASPPAPLPLRTRAVGFAWRAARLASPAAGLFLALTGARAADASDLIWLGVATHFCPAADVPSLRGALEAAPASADTVMAQRCAGGAPGGPGPLQRAAPALERALGPLLAGGGYAAAGATEAEALRDATARLEKASS